MACVADDILVFGVGDSLEEPTLDHDQNLASLLEWCHQKPIKLNKHKLALRVQEAVKSAKKQFPKTAKGGEDFHLGVLLKPNTPSQGIGRSPAQQLMNRRTRTLLLTTSTLL